MRPGAARAIDDMVSILVEASGEEIPPGLDPRSVWTPSMAKAAIALPALQWPVAFGVPRPKRLSLSIFGHIRRVRLAKRILTRHLQEEE